MAELEAAMGSAGFSPIMDDCRRLVLEGVTSAEEINRVLGDG